MRETAPKPPRRLFLASIVAAIAAGGATALATFGAVTAPETETFQFARGTSFATGEADRLDGYLTAAMQDDRIAVVIVGHSGTQGDATANQALSVSRAEIAAEKAVALGIPRDRITARGVGGGAPLAKDPAQSDRAYEAQLARVDVTLQVRR